MVKETGAFNALTEYLGVDEDGTKEISLSKTVIKKLPPEIIE